MSRTAAPAMVAAIVAACASFDEPVSPNDGGVSEAGAEAGVSGTGFWASRSGFDVCSDFDDAKKKPIEGWDAFNGPNGAEPKVDSSDSRSSPSSVRFDFTGAAATGLGFRKTLGPGSVYHVEAAVRFDTKVQADYVDIARLEIGTPVGEFVTQIDMQPAGMHFGFCPENRANCLYGNPPHDLQSWKTIAFDIDTTQSKATLTIGGVIEEERTFPAATIDKVTVTVGPREVASGNTIVVRYDDILVSHR